MIASLSGTLKSKSPTKAIIDVNGVGYAVHIPLSTYEVLGDEGQSVSLRTLLLVRDDALVLFGFGSETELTMFQLLTSVAGIGPRTAQGILSGTSVADLKRLIHSADVGMLTRLPGIGKKTAERLIVELREKISKSDGEASARDTHSPARAHIYNEAMLALTSLGYTRSSADRAIVEVLKQMSGSEPSIEDVLKRALQVISTKG